VTDRQFGDSTPENGSPEEISSGAPSSELVPYRPTPAIRAELVALLQADQSRLGEVYRGLERGLNPVQIAGELQVATPNFVYNYGAIVKSLVDGELPTGPTLALQAARRYRAILRASRLSNATRQYLETKLRELERRADDPAARVEEVQRAKEQTEEAEASNEVGIYVYALPHYLRYPFDPESGRTLMKIGRSDSDVIIRFRQQTRTTALPEEPVLLRIYRTEAGPAVEANFHRLLQAADHHRSVARTAGREWFVTSTRFLDEVARVLALTVVVVNEADVGDDD
jgi:hypothetical protein